MLSPPVKLFLWVVFASPFVLVLTKGLEFSHGEPTTAGGRQTGLLLPSSKTERLSMEKKQEGSDVRRQDVGSPSHQAHGNNIAEPNILRRGLLAPEHVPPIRTDFLHVPQDCSSDFLQQGCVPYASPEHDVVHTIDDPVHYEGNRW